LGWVQKVGLARHYLVSHFVSSSSTTYACLLAWTKVLWLKVFVVSNASGVPRCWVLLVFSASSEYIRDKTLRVWFRPFVIYFTRLLNYLTGSRSYGGSTSQLSFLILCSHLLEGISRSCTSTLSIKEFSAFVCWYLCFGSTALPNMYECCYHKIGLLSPLISQRLGGVQTRSTYPSLFPKKLYYSLRVGLRLPIAYRLSFY